MLPLSARRPALTILLVAAVVAIVHAVSTIGGPLPGPLPLFPPDNWWNLDVSSLPLDPGSDAFMNFVGRTRQAHPDFGGDVSTGSVEVYGYPYVVVDSTVPLKTVQFDYSDESDGVDHTTNQSFPFYPIPDEAITQPHWIENGEPGNQDLRGSSDRHMLIVDKDHKRLFELFSVFYDGTQWHAGSGAFFDLTTNARRPDGWTSADAAGLAMLPGLVRYDEVYGTAEINHAFRVTVRATNGYVYPASHRAGSTSGALPMGARLRMKQARDISTYPADMQKIFRAMKKYGLIVADNGSDLYVSGTYDTRWNNDILNPAFHSLTGNDFEVVQLGIKPPTVTADSVSPASGSGSVQSFALKYSDSAGAADLGTAWTWISSTSASTAANSCMFYYNRPANTLLLLNDAATAWTSATLGATGTLQNSQCSIAMGSSTTASSSGNTLTINAAVRFKPAFNGTKNLSLYAAGSTSNSGWQTRGSWTALSSTLTGDFDGDGATDLTIFRPSTGTWFTLQSGANFTAASSTQWGNSADIPVPGDYDGDGKTDVAVFRPANGTWYIMQSSTGTAVGVQWGNAQDRPVPGDYDGDGKTDIAVFRPSTGTWFIIYSSSGTAGAVPWGNAGDIPVAADYDGDGKTDIAIFRPANGTWYVIASTTGAAYGVQWGNGSDLPVVGDYDGDGKADVAVFRPSNGTWYIIRSSTGVAYGVPWGNGSDVPVPGDYDGDGRTDIAVFRSSTGTWFVIRSRTGTGFSMLWGNGNDVPTLKRP
jgi:hypothetical protein